MSFSKYYQFSKKSSWYKDSMCGARHDIWITGTKNNITVRLNAWEDPPLFNWDNLAKGKWVKKNCGEGGICHSAFVSIINETTGEVIVNNIELFAGDSFARTWTVYKAGIYKITVSEHSTARCKNLNYSQETKYTVKASDVPQPPNGEGDTLSTPPTHDVTNAITMMSMLIGLSVVVYKYYFD